MAYTYELLTGAVLISRFAILILLTYWITERTARNYKLAMHSPLIVINDEIL